MTNGWQYADVWDVVAEVRASAPAFVHGERRVSWGSFKRAPPVWPARSSTVAQ